MSDRSTSGSDRPEPNSSSTADSPDRPAKRRKPKAKRRPSGAAHCAAVEAKGPPPVGEGGANRSMILIHLQGSHEGERRVFPPS